MLQRENLLAGLAQAQLSKRNRYVSEGPQVLRRTEWLDRYLAKRTVLRCISTRTRIPAESLTGRQIQRAFCKGKHIFIEFDSGVSLHNHLLMRGTWKKLRGNQLFLPDDAWLGLYVGPYTICNLNGQMLRLVSQDEVTKQLATLGPDAMAQPYPAHEIRNALAASMLPISEALLDQAVLAGVGNIAKSEILFQTGLDPRVPANEVNGATRDRLLESIRQVLWASYHAGGRWVCQVYRRQGQRCKICNSVIRMVKLAPSKRATYYCTRCQR
jgi:endonuclease VIII